VTQNEIKCCSEKALRWPPAGSVRSIALFIFSFTVAKKLLAFMQRTFTDWDLQMGFPVPQGAHFFVGSCPIRHLIRFSPGWIRV
jgi:hypothetical protein